MSSLVATLLATGGCSGPPAAAPVVSLPLASMGSSASAGAPPPRRPDGVVLEPPPTVPTAVAVGDARGVVALRPTLSLEAIRGCVQQLLDAWQRASLDGLAALLASDAGPLEARARGPGALVEAFRQRLRARDYRRLEGVELARLDAVEHYAWSELGGADGLARPESMHPDEVYVRVPLEVTQVAGEKYFESTVVLLLREEQGRARIVGYAEVP